MPGTERPRRFQAAIDGDRQPLRPMLILALAQVGMQLGNPVEHIVRYPGDQRKTFVRDHDHEDGHQQGIGHQISRRPPGARVILRHAESRPHHAGKGIEQQNADKKADHHQGGARQHPQEQHVALFAMLPGHALSVGDGVGDGPQGGCRHNLHHQDDPADNPHEPQKKRHHGQVVGQGHASKKQRPHGARDQPPQERVIDVRGGHDAILDSLPGEDLQHQPPGAAVRGAAHECARDFQRQEPGCRCLDAGNIKVAKGLKVSQGISRGQV